MKSKIINSFWGIALILVSGILVAEALGLVSFGSVTGRDWALVFGTASAALLLTYFLSGVKQWGWLFPALICAAMSWGSVRTGSAFDLIHPVWPLLAALAIPLYVGFALNRKSWGLLIMAYILSATAFIIASGEMVTSLGPIASPNHTLLWAVFVAAGPLFLLALPFFFLYFWSKENWWALIPAGGLTSVGLNTLLALQAPNGQNALLGVANAAMLLGFAATMGILWLRRATQPTGWAKYPAAGFLILAVAALILGNGWSDLSQNVIAVVFLAGSVAFFIAYFLHGVRKWGWLLPACACAGLALTILMDDRNMDGAITGAPLFAGLALPLFIGFAMDRKHWGLLLLASLLAAFTIFLLVVDRVPDEWSGVTFMSVFALPFFVTYFWSKSNWWALIPAGSLASLGVTIMLDILVPHEEYPALPNRLSWDVYIWVLFLGLAATFGALWLRRKTQPTGWAKYPAAGLLAIAFLAIILGGRFQEFWSAAVVLVTGVMLLLATFIKKLPSAGGQPPEVKA